MNSLHRKHIPKDLPCETLGAKLLESAPTAVSPADSSAEATIPLPPHLRTLFRTKFIRTWTDVIQHYTKRSLTRSEDKLSEISALARKAHDIQRCDYLAGLWKDSLVYELGWQSWGHHELSHIYRAPSWSWASVDSPVESSYLLLEVIRENRHPLFEYMNHDIKLSNPEDPYGPVLSGYLTLRAQTIMVTLTKADSLFSSPWMSINGCSIKRGHGDPPHLKGILNVFAMPLLLCLFPGNTDALTESRPIQKYNRFLLTALVLEKEEKNCL